MDKTLALDLLSRLMSAYGTQLESEYNGHRDDTLLYATEDLREELERGIEEHWSCIATQP